MITSMIDREFSRVHMTSMKRPKNLVSLIIGLALDNTGQVDWYQGELFDSNDNVADTSDSVAMKLVLKENGIPGYFLDMLVSIDLDIPPAEIVLDKIDPHLLVMSFDAPAFHIPMSAKIEYLTICLAASRILWECKSSLILPEPSNLLEFETLLMGIGIQALTLGGPEVYKQAKELLSADSFWETELATKEEDASDFESETDNE